MKKLFTIAFIIILFVSGCGNVNDERTTDNYENSNLNELTEAEQEYVTSVKQIFTTMTEEMDEINSELKKATNAPSLYRNEEWKAEIEEGLKRVNKMVKQLEDLVVTDHVPARFQSEHDAVLDALALIDEAGDKIMNGINEINPRAVSEGASILHDSIDLINNILVKK